jgi:lipid-binding SYLF domain-containing protein
MEVEPMTMKISLGLAISFAAATVSIAGCATAPATPSKRHALTQEALATLASMTARDPSLREVVDRSHGFAVFPKIGKGGLLVGGAYGKGVVFEQGRPVGYAELNQASVGLQLGAQTFSELIVFRDPTALRRLQAGDFDIGANASAVLVTAGAAGTAEAQGGISVFVMPVGGLMAELSVSGQMINYEPRG